jgi:predicted RNA-binding protein YlqC (UPF0109 family)
MSAEAEYLELLGTVVQPLLTDPEQFESRARRVKNAVVIEFKVADDDTGRVIGRGGATIRSIRAVLEHAGDRNDDRISVELLEA